MTGFGDVMNCSVAEVLSLCKAAGCAAPTVGDDVHAAGREAGAQHRVLPAGVADADDGVRVRQRELQRLVQRDGRRVGKAHQRVVREQHLHMKPQGVAHPPTLNENHYENHLATQAARLDSLTWLLHISGVLSATVVLKAESFVFGVHAYFVRTISILVFTLSRLRPPRTAACARRPTLQPMVRACRSASCAMAEKAWCACSSVMRSRSTTSRSSAKPPNSVGGVASAYTGRRGA